MSAFFYDWFIVGIAMQQNTIQHHWINGGELVLASNNKGKIATEVYYKYTHEGKEYIIKINEFDINGRIKKTIMYSCIDNYKNSKIIVIVLTVVRR